ncbi:MAG: protein TolQ [Betaproteobacteria bacterium SG8_40]|jgi:biopolymer transport protein TolQ|nr:MAG: protein TolQ [Betaproteobacteria bacterium SG8_40]
MEVSHNMGFWALIGNASFLVQLVMAILLGMSIMSWWYIFRKMFSIRETLQQTDAFEAGFVENASLPVLYENEVKSRHRSASLGRIFVAGFREASKLRKIGRGTLSGTQLEGARRAMRAAYQREMDRLESKLSFLATVGSVSPYIGLFGTVWGIMNSFRGLANVGQATLASVAPGIAEALIATAMGLFAAIPAVVGFNHFVRNLERLSTRFDSFMEELSNRLQGEPDASEEA